MITITERAAHHVKRLAVADGKLGSALRVAVTAGGCSGFSWDPFFDDEKREDDLVFEQYGVEIRVDPRTMRLVQDTEIDYVDGIQAAGFTFRNPQVKSTCGCGKSFNT